MDTRGLGAALVFTFALAAGAPATAQLHAPPLHGPLQQEAQSIAATASRSAVPDPRLDLDGGANVRRSGLIAAYRVGDNLQVGVGRFAVPEIARPRTNLETERHPTAVRPRERGIAAVGVSLSF